MSATPGHVERIDVRTGRLGEGMVVSRALPTKQRRMVGAWCFLDHLGPISFSAGQGMHVGAHPHTRLQTFTWMVEGEIVHRDSLGSEQVLRAGQVNLMTAGTGISHTEDSLQEGQRLHAAQLWIALPEAVADQPPAFVHYPEVPQWQAQGCAWSLMAGSYGAHQAPTQLYSPLLGLELCAAEATVVQVQLKPDFEYGLLALEGAFELEGQRFESEAFAYLKPGAAQLTLGLEAHARVLVLGGAPFTEPVIMWWNFLGRDWDSIRSYSAQWSAGHARFGDVAQGMQRRLPAPPLP